MSTPTERQPSVYRAEDLTAIRYRKRSLEMYPMLEQELRTLAGGYSSPHLALCGMSFGAFSSVTITLGTVSTLTESAKNKFSAALLIMGVFTLYFGLMAIRDWNRSRKIISQIRKETVEAVIAPPVLQR